MHPAFCVRHKACHIASRCCELLYAPRILFATLCPRAAPVRRCRSWAAQAAELDDALATEERTEAASGMAFGARLDEGVSEMRKMRRGANDKRACWLRTRTLPRARVTGAAFARRPRDCLGARPMGSLCAWPQGLSWRASHGLSFGVAPGAALARVPWAVFACGALPGLLWPCVPPS
jgi:hypothetical protein